MSWRWRLGELFGIVVYMHATFLLLIGWVVLAHVLQGRSMGEALGGVFFILLLFACVVMHEYGHALTARRFGIRTRDITLLPIGGIARLERMPREPSQELWIALAGPAVNVVIAAALSLMILLFAGAATLTRVQVIGGDLLAKLLWVNLVIALFNLIPAFPMDGGRVLRALLARRMEYTRATRIAANVGQLMAFGFGFVGLFANPFLLFIALFVYLGAEAEARMVHLQSLFRGIPVRQAMVTRFVTLSPEDTLETATQVLLDGSQQDFPVVQEGRLLGLLARRDLLRELQQQGSGGQVRGAMNLAISPVAAPDPLEGAFQRMQSEELTALPVVDGSRLVGLLTMENIAEFLMIRAAVGGDA
jgi:Zn-dependent protease/predicted transcriptional regulator